MPESFPVQFSIAPEDAGKRLDQVLVAHLDVSRARVQQLISEQKVLVNDTSAKASLKLRGGERITTPSKQRETGLRSMRLLKITSTMSHEDGDLAIINKSAGKMVHAGAGATDDERNRGTLVNALLHHFASLSAVGGEMRPGIVHRLDKETSGLIVVSEK